MEDSHHGDVTRTASGKIYHRHMTASIASFLGIRSHVAPPAFTHSAWKSLMLVRISCKKHTDLDSTGTIRVMKAFHHGTGISKLVNRLQMIDVAFPSWRKVTRHLEFLYVSGGPPWLIGTLDHPSPGKLYERR